MGKDQVHHGVNCLTKQQAEQKARTLGRQAIIVNVNGGGEWAGIWLSISLIEMQGLWPTAVRWFVHDKNLNKGHSP